MEDKQSPVLLLAAAGRGKRMEGSKNKQYLFLAGKPVLAHTLKAFLDLNLFSQVIVIVAPGEENAFRRWVLLPFFADHKTISIVQGGKERQSSVFNGLKALRQQKQSDKDFIVCIHDGARPLITAPFILNVYNEALSTGAAIPGIPLKDTIKEVDHNFNVLKTPFREQFIAAQTPQCFKFSLLWQSHQKAWDDGFSGSDDASLVERLGYRVKVLPGSDENLKITTQVDLLLAEAYLSVRSVKSEKEKKDFKNEYAGKFNC